MTTSTVQMDCFVGRSPLEKRIIASSDFLRRLQNNRLAGHFVVPLGCMKLADEHCFRKRTGNSKVWHGTVLKMKQKIKDQRLGGGKKSTKIQLSLLTQKTEC